LRAAVIINYGEFPPQDLRTEFSGRFLACV